MKLINKDALIQKVKKEEEERHLDKDTASTLQFLIDEYAEPVDAEPVRHGKWLFIRMDEDGNGVYECSLCHKGERHVPQIKVNYCWNCGAKMEK